MGATYWTAAGRRARQREVNQQGPHPHLPFLKALSHRGHQCSAPNPGRVALGPRQGRGELFSFRCFAATALWSLGTFLVTQLSSGHFLFKEVRGSSVLEKPRRNYKKRLHLPRPTARTLNGRLSSGPSCWKQGALAPTSTLSWWTRRGEPPSPPTPSTAKGQDEG